MGRVGKYEQVNLPQALLGNRPAVRIRKPFAKLKMLTSGSAVDGAAQA
jgi:hypothetical protein